jgi:hypothetical protein
MSQIHNTGTKMEDLIVFDHVTLSLAVKEIKVEKEINFDFLFGLVTKYTIEEKGILDFFADYEIKFRKGDYLT